MPPEIVLAGTLTDLTVPIRRPRLGFGRFLAGPWLLSVCFLMGAVGRIGAEDWPGWRGPTADGVSAEVGLPTVWEPDAGIQWKMPIPGRGHSSPITWEDAIFLTSADESTNERILWRLDRETGNVAWRQTVLVSPLEPIHPLNSHASSTPATDGERVYITFLDVDQTVVFAYDLSGKKVWEARPGPFSSKHGFCSSPVIYQDSLLINGDHDGKSFLARLDRKTGETMWKVPRLHETRSYSVPRVLPIAGKDQIILTGSFRTTGFDIDSGEMVWSVDGPSEQMVASILDHQNLIFAMGGFPERHLLAIEKGGRGDITASHIVWRTHRSVPYVPSAVMANGLLHVVSDEGMYTCYEPMTGKLLQQKRVSSHISGSIVAGDGRLYITDDAGATTVLLDDGSFTVVSRNSIGEDCFTSAAISDGVIYIRGVNHLFAINGAPSPKSAAAVR